MALLKGWRFPNWVTLLLGLLFAAAWLVVVILVEEVEGEHVPKILSAIASEFFKAVIIGVCVGLGVEVYLKITERRAEQTAREQLTASMLSASDLKHLHSGRTECKEVFKKLAKDTNVRQIDIAGISLRDFLRTDGRLWEVWDSILQRLRDEELREAHNSQRLRIKLLLLDPLSAEGRFRYRVEERIVVDPDKPYDIDQALREIQRVRRSIYHDKPQDFLQVRLYGHCPFSFMFLTDGAAFVEQYYYRDELSSSTPPVLEYSTPSERSKLFRLSFDIIWDNAQEERITVGTALPIERARIRNIFRAEQRDELARRQVACIEAVKSGTIDILAISGNYYMSNERTTEALLSVSSTKTNSQAIMVRLALVNPVSQQAILRAVADDRTIRDIKDALCKWDWTKHRGSRLYQDLQRSIYRVADWQERGYLFDLRLYSSSVACALLLTPDSMFIEQYVYGRTKKLQEKYLLRGEYPVIEYALTSKDEDKTEHEIISSNFQIIWDCYSIPYQEYLQRSQVDDFTTNLNTLQTELGCVVSSAPDPQGKPTGDQTPLAAS